jgi:arylsulfatase A-like enzyme
MKTFFGLLVALLTLPFPILAAEQRPNIVFILADDYGLDGVGIYGSDRFKGRTPNIDRLAQSGIRFENAYCTPLCGPTRCLLNTGRYGFRTGGTSNQNAGQPKAAEEPSLARTLQSAGYATGMAGKWRQVGGSPGDWGFGEFITDPTAGGWYWKTSYTRNGQLVQTDREVYNPDVCLDFAKDFFRHHQDEPFYFYFPTHLVHGPILKTPESKNGGNLYDDNVAYLDKQVGQLVAELEKLGLREKTLILFASDNGTAKQSGRISGRPVNGQKGTMLEGGAHVPLIANWKGVTPAGTVLKDLVDFSDLFPTFVELAGTTLPAGVKFDGRSFAPQLRGQTGHPRDWIFVQLGAKWYVRNAGWKLNQSGELFDLSEAPFVEKTVAVAGQTEAAKAARQQLQAALNELNPAAGKNSSGDQGKAGNKVKRPIKRQKPAAKP